MTMKLAVLLALVPSATAALSDCHTPRGGGDNMDKGKVEGGPPLHGAVARLLACLNHTTADCAEAVSEVKSTLHCAQEAWEGKRGGEGVFDGEGTHGGKEGGEGKRGGEGVFDGEGTRGGKEDGKGNRGGEGVFDGEGTRGGKEGGEGKRGGEGEGQLQGVDDRKHGDEERKRAGKGGGEHDGDGEGRRGEDKQREDEFKDETSEASKPKAGEYRAKQGSSVDEPPPLPMLIGVGVAIAVLSCALGCIGGTQYARRASSHRLNKMTSPVAPAPVEGKVFCTGVPVAVDAVEKKAQPFSDDLKKPADERKGSPFAKGDFSA